MISFNPQEFFRKTSQFASQGRGHFQLTSLPKWYENETTGETTGYINQLSSDRKELIRLGFDLLKSGITAKSITAPVHNLATSEGFSFGGVTRKIPFLQTFGELDVTFLIMGASILEARALHFALTYWQEIIAGPRITNGIKLTNFSVYSKQSGKPISDNTPFAIEYYDNYIAEGQVKIYSPSLAPATGESSLTPTPIIDMSYLELYPSSLGILPTSWDNQDTPITLPVTFNFYYAYSNI